jgi:hypothetical protein
VSMTKSLTALLAMAVAALFSAGSAYGDLATAEALVEFNASNNPGDASDEWTNLGSAGGFLTKGNQQNMAKPPLTKEHSKVLPRYRANDFRSLGSRRNASRK